jgi:uncharacterized protein (DUF302 family)
MSYYFSRTIFAPFPDAVDRVKAALKSQGFGVLTDIDIRGTLKEKIGAEFRDYRILGACNPALAYRALTSEDKIGTMLPCNIIVQDLGDGRIEVAAIDPRAAMGRMDNPELERIAAEVATKLSSVVAAA